MSLDSRPNVRLRNGDSVTSRLVIASTASRDADEGGRCGATRIIGRTEFVCIADEHDELDPRTGLSMRDAHVFAARYPYRGDR